jgi:hypothetical protein
VVPSTGIDDVTEDWAGALKACFMAANTPPLGQFHRRYAGHGLRFAWPDFRSELCRLTLADARQKAHF